MSKFKNYLLYIFLALILVFIERALIDYLPPAYNRLNILLVSLLIAFFFFNMEKIWPAALIAALAFDFLSFRFFGAYLISIALTILAADLLLRNWLTTRSTYSFLALSVLATLIFNLLLYTCFAIGDGNWFLGQALFWKNLGLEEIWNGGAVFIFFWIMHLTTNRLKPVFLDKR